MASETFYFSGEAIYPRLNKADTKFNPNGVYSIGIILDDESEVEYATSGMRVGHRTHNGSKPFITFKREDKKMIKDEMVTFGPPQVLDANKNKLDKLVGNGSKVTAKVIVFDTRMGKGHRLDAVMVNELVEFVPTPQGEPAQAQAPQPAAPARKKMPW